MPTPDADDIRDAAATAAEEGIASSTIDGSSAQAMDPMKQLDVADRVSASAAGSRNSWFGLRTKKIIPGGTG